MSQEPSLEGQDLDQLYSPTQCFLSDGAFNSISEGKAWSPSSPAKECPPTPTPTRTIVRTPNNKLKRLARNLSFGESKKRPCSSRLSLRLESLFPPENSEGTLMSEPPGTSSCEGSPTVVAPVDSEDIFTSADVNLTPPASPTGREMRIQPPELTFIPASPVAQSPFALKKSKERKFSSNVNPFSPEPRSKHDRKYSDSGPLGAGCRGHYHRHFEQIERIGSGSYGEVFKCRNRTDGMLYAVKKLKRPFKGKGDRQHSLREVYALAALGDHPHIVRYFTGWVEDERLFIQMGFCGGGTLESKRKSFSGFEFQERELCEITRQVALGLQHIHSRQLIHLDIKPENIYMTPSGQYKIGDFGCIVLNGSEVQDVFEGDNRYLPREILNENFTQLPKADIFSLGCTIYELALGKPLPDTGSEYHDIRAGKISLPCGKFSGDFIALVQSMLNPDPELRPSAQQLLEHLASSSTYLNNSLDSHVSLFNSGDLLAQGNYRLKYEKKAKKVNKLKEELEKERTRSSELQSLLDRVLSCKTVFDGIERKVDETGSKLDTLVNRLNTLPNFDLTEANIHRSI